MLRTLPLLLIVAFLVFLGLGGTTTELFPHQDKVHHALGCFVVALALRVAFPGMRFAQALFWSVLGSALFEGLQAFVPGRTPSLADVAACLVGTLLGWCAWFPAWRRRRAGLALAQS